MLGFLETGSNGDVRSEWPRNTTQSETRRGALPLLKLAMWLAASSRSPSRHFFETLPGTPAALRPRNRGQNAA